MVCHVESVYYFPFFMTATLSAFSYFVHKIAVREMSWSYTSKHITDKVPALQFQKLRKISQKK